MFLTSRTAVLIALTAIALGGCAADDGESDPTEDVDTASEELSMKKSVSGLKAHALFVAMDKAGLAVDGGAGSLYVGATKISCDTEKGTDASVCRITPSFDPSGGPLTPFTVKGKKADRLADALRAIKGVPTTIGGGDSAQIVRSRVFDVTCDERNDGFGSGSPDHDAHCALKLKK